MLEIRNLQAGIDGKTILKGIDLTIRPGEVHALMGPNGSGKSTLAQVLAGSEAFTVTAGEIRYEGQDLLALAPEERALAGLFLAFQYPVEIPGVSNLYFLRSALNAQRKARGEQELDAMDFLALAREKMKLFDLDPELMNRSLNVGFSGGEKKRNEGFQMAVLAPKLAILDETDSGLDIDALKVVARGVNALRGPDHAALVITHYQRLLEYIVPDRVHVLADGRIVRSGGKELALELEARGYGWLEGAGSSAA
jgi:Fe-S cluster assembly ATP-binding protein